MITHGTYFQNSEEEPIVFGEVEPINPPRPRLRGEEEKEGILCKPVLTGFCGTDFELMHMGQRGELTPKFPSGMNRLINGHEGVVWVPEQNRFAIVLIRGGDSYDPTRFGDDETYFEYGCDKADGLMCEENYFNPDMLLEIPPQYITGEKIPLSIAKRLVFSDPFACMIFQLERMEDLGSAHLFRVEMAKQKCSEAEARAIAKESVFERTLIFGLGTTGLFIGDLIHQNHPNAKIYYVGLDPPDHEKVVYACQKTGAEYIENSFDNEEELANAILEKIGGKATLFIGCSGTDIDHRIAFDNYILGNNGIYNSFSLGPTVSYKSMPFGFRNYLIFGSINFRQVHMEKAIPLLAESDYDRMVGEVSLEDFKQDPKGFYENKIYCKGAPTKTITIWSPEFIDLEN
jgi:threonine dehydrogenase-like Zn-dependent dehydrogenase